MIRGTRFENIINDYQDKKLTVNKFADEIIKVYEKELETLCESGDNETLTLDDINNAFWGDIALKRIEDYPIVDYDNPSDVLGKVRINNQRKVLEFEFFETK